MAPYFPASKPRNVRAAPCIKGRWTWRWELSWVWRYSCVLTLISAMLVNMFGTNSRQFQGLAHQHAPLQAQGLQLENPLNTSAVRLRLGFDAGAGQLASPKASPLHQHAQTGYHLHITELKDSLTRWLDLEAHTALAHDPEQSDTGSQSAPLAILPAAPVMMFAPQRQQVAMLSMLARDDAFLKRAERPPNSSAQGFQKTCTVLKLCGFFYGQFKS
jgi:hypothetical protein